MNISNKWPIERKNKRIKINIGMKERNGKMITVCACTNNKKEREKREKRLIEKKEIKERDREKPDYICYP